MMLATRMPRSPVQTGRSAPHVTPRTRILCSKPDTTPSTKKQTEGSKPGLGLKAAWYGAEQLGNIIGALSNTSPSSAASTSTQSVMLSRADAIAAIRADYGANYFVSGQGDLTAYAPQCRFADPFASFRGVQRFKNNVSNLGSLMCAWVHHIKRYTQQQATHVHIHHQCCMASGRTCSWRLQTGKSLTIGWLPSGGSDVSCSSHGDRCLLLRGGLSTCLTRCLGRWWIT